MQNVADYAFEADMQLHNPYQEVYKLDPKRQTFCFQNLDYDKKIVVDQINYKINFLYDNGFFRNDFSAEIRVTDFSWSFRYTETGFDIGSDVKFVFDKTLVYLEINNNVIRNGKMIDKINDKVIYYNPLSFRQSDLSIKEKIYNILQINNTNSNICFIGGEMVFYCTLLKPTNYIMFTDFDSIFDDATNNLINYNYLINYNHLINYDTCSINIPNGYTLITNTSKSGLGINLATQINRNNFENIIIISCNKKSFLRDKKILTNYKINKIYDIYTNYNVTVYFFIKI